MDHTGRDAAATGTVLPLGASAPGGVTAADGTTGATTMLLESTTQSRAPPTAPVAAVPPSTDAASVPTPVAADTTRAVDGAGPVGGASPVWGGSLTNDHAADVGMRLTSAVASEGAPHCAHDAQPLAPAGAASSARATAVDGWPPATEWTLGGDGSRVLDDPVGASGVGVGGAPGTAGAGAGAGSNGAGAGTNGAAAGSNDTGVAGAGASVAGAGALATPAAASYIPSPIAVPPPRRRAKPAAKRKKKGKGTPAPAPAPVPAHITKMMATTTDTPRRRLAHITSIDAVVDVLRSCQRAVVLTGAGVSTACGIPDFRSAGTGLYSMIEKAGIDGINEAEEVFDIRVFREEPEVFYSVAPALLSKLGVAPSAAHRFIAELERRGKLLRNFTQNIDGLEGVAGVTRVVRCHGTLATASCVRCGSQVPTTAILPDAMAGRVPLCVKCPRGPRCVRAVMKPDIVFFHEALPSAFEDIIEHDMATADVFVIMGSSMKVRPVSNMLAVLAPHVPVVLLNRETLSTRHGVDVELLGDCDATVADLARRLEWPSVAAPAPTPGPPQPPCAPTFVPPNCYLYPGARGVGAACGAQVVGGVPSSGGTAGAAGPQALPPPAKRRRGRPPGRPRKVDKPASPPLPPPPPAGLEASFSALDTAVLIEAWEDVGCAVGADRGSDPLAEWRLVADVANAGLRRHRTVAAVAALFGSLFAACARLLPPDAGSSCPFADEVEEVEEALAACVGASPAAPPSAPLRRGGRRGASGGGARSGASVQPSHHNVVLAASEWRSHSLSLPVARDLRQQLSDTRALRRFKARTPSGAAGGFRYPPALELPQWWQPADTGCVAVGLAKHGTGEQSAVAILTDDSLPWAANHDQRMAFAAQPCSNGDTGREWLARFGGVTTETASPTDTVKTATTAAATAAPLAEKE